MSGDDYGVFGGGEDDAYGVFGGSPKPKKKRRGRTRDDSPYEPPVVGEDDALDVVPLPDKGIPLAVEGADTRPDRPGNADDYGVFGSGTPTKKKLAEVSGEAAGPPRPPDKRLREAPSHADILLNAFGDSIESFGQGFGGNAIDELAGYTRAGLGKLGLMRDVGSAEELTEGYKQHLDQATADYPDAHGAGQMVQGALMGAGLGAGGAHVAARLPYSRIAQSVGKLAQGALAQGALAAAESGGAEYMDSRNLGRTALAAGIGGAAGATGTVIGNKVSKWFARTPEEELLRELEEIAAANRMKPPGKGPSGPDYGTPEVPVPEAAPSPAAAATPEAPRPLPNQEGAPYDPYALQSAPQVPEPPMSRNGPVGPAWDPHARASVPAPPEAPRPQPNPAEMAYGYDPRALEPPPVLPEPGPPRPLPTSGSGQWPPPFTPEVPTPGSVAAPERARGVAAQWPPAYTPAPPTPAASAAEAAADDIKDPAVRLALETFTPTLKARSAPAELVDWAQKVKAHNLPPAVEKALLRRWTEHVKDTLPSVDPERLMRGEEADLVAYTLGELDQMPAPRIAPAPEADEASRYALGELLDSPNVASPRLRGSNGRAVESPYAVGDLLGAPSAAAPRVRGGSGRMPAPEYAVGDLLDGPAPGARPRVRGAAEPGAAPADYALGELPAPTDALPRPRTGGALRDAYVNEAAPAVAEAAAPSAPPYSVGDLVTDAPRGPLALRPEDMAPSGELRELALRRAAGAMPRDQLGALLGLGGEVAGRVAPRGTGVRTGLRALSAGRKLMSPDARAFALETGELVPNVRAGQLARAGVRAAWELGAPAVVGGKVNAQDGEQTAYGDAPTLNYALSATLSRGNTGLSQEDEEKLTRAVVEGDQDAITATDFRLRQRYPGYARRVERELRALNEQE
jgi:hypothetical protein